MDEKFLEAIDSYHEHIDAKQGILQDDELICECHCVSALDVRLLFADAKQVDIEVLKNYFGLGTACGSCLKAKDDWISRLY